MRKAIFILITMLTFNITLKGQPETIWQLLYNGDIIRWAYSGGDEFNENELDTTKWDYHVGSRACNKELQYFTKGKNVEFEYNSEINSRVIKLIAKEEQVYEKAVSYLPDDEILFCEDENIGKNKRYFNYTSAEIQYRQRFKYGLFEIRFKLPEGQGLWPAFWLYGGHPKEEFDIFEYKGETPNKIHINVHYGIDGNMDPNLWLTANGNFSDGFNVMMGEWGPNLIFWYLNGSEIYAVSRNLNYKEGLKANLSIASDNGTFGPGPDNSTTFPEIYEIDYIRIWTRLDCEQNINICDYNQSLTDPTVITGQQISMGGTACNATIQGPPATAPWIDGEYLTLIATEKIELKPGFKAESGSHFSTKIVDCPGSQKNLEKERNIDSTLRIISEIVPDNTHKALTTANIDNPPLLYTKIYPNPTEGKINIEFVGKIDTNIKIKLTNSSGIVVFIEDNVTGNSLDIDISHLTKGIYILTGFFGDNSISEKIVLQ